MVGEVKLLITRSWVQNLSPTDERSNRETSRRIGFNSVYLVSLQGLPFTLLYFIYIDLHRLLFIHYFALVILTTKCQFNWFYTKLIFSTLVFLPAISHLVVYRR